jgi:hypothetical protein
VDSVHCHANWAAGLGGISFPLLADFHPKGKVASAYGLYLEDRGITDRATVIIDAGGVVRHASSVTPAGSRDIAELAALCEQVDRDYVGTLPASVPPPGIPSGTLYVKSNCGFSQLLVKNVSEDASALRALENLTGKPQAPALELGGEVLLESTDIIRRLVTGATGLTS